MTTFSPRALATGVGSLPHPEVSDALRVVFENFKAVPFWPQLPRRDFRENMYVQFSQDLPSVKIDPGHEWIGAETGENTLAEVEAFYARYLSEDTSLFALGEEYAAGLHALRGEKERLGQARWVKGQITGPISFGLKVTDRRLRPMLYDDTLRDVLVKHIARTAQWHEQFLGEFGKTLTFVDEPSLSLIGASVVALNRDEVVRDLEEVYAGMKGLKGTHCCGNTDWSLLLQTSIDIISFDAFDYAENLALFADEVKAFLGRGGALAWGIVPTVEEEINRQTPEHLVELLDAAVDLFVKKGIDRHCLYEQALITPACGLGTLPVAAAERALTLANAVSERVRERERLV